MMKNLSIPQLPQGLNNLLIAGAAVYVVYMLSRGLGQMDQAANTLTKPLGQMWSDASAWASG